MRFVLSNPEVTPESALALIQRLRAWKAPAIART